MMPINTIINKITKATKMLLFSIMISDRKEIVPETNIVIKNIVTTHRIVLFRSFFDADGSDLDTSLIPFKICNKTVADRINLTA